MNLFFNCRVCKSLLFKKKYIKGEVTGSNVALYKCKNCDSYFSKVELTKKTFINYESGSIDVFMNKNYVSNRVQDIISFAKSKNWLSPSEDKNFLDIGCGVGWSLVVANRNGFNAYGVEPNKLASEFGNNVLKVKVINSLFQPNIFGQKKFDFIIMDQVLEHVCDPREMIIDAYRLLKPGGIFFIGVPPLDWSRKLLSISFQFNNKFLRYVENNKYFKKLFLFAKKYDIFFGPEGHINYFSLKAILFLLQNCDVNLVYQYHLNRKRVKYFPFLKLSTGSFICRKK